MTSNWHIDLAQTDPALTALLRPDASDRGFQPVSLMERILLGDRRMVADSPALFAPVKPAGESGERVASLLTEHYRFVWRTLRRLGVHEAAVDDAAQQVFLVASGRLADVPKEKERSFLMGVAVRTAANARRTQSHRREDADLDAVSEHPSPTNPEELLDWKQRRQKLDAWLSRLDLDLRAPFVLFELEGLALDEIADTLELPLGTVKTRLRKARAIFLEAAREGGAR